MTMPNMFNVMIPTLHALAKGAENANDAVPYIRRHFGLTEAEMAETIPSGKKLRIVDRINWGMFHIMQAGLVERPAHGKYRITGEGQKVAAEEDSIDQEYLKGLPKYAAWDVERRRTNSNDEARPLPLLIEASSSPEDVMQNANDALRQALADELLDLARSFSTTPDRFEQLIVDLLIAMGYGGGDPGMGARLGKSGDGGIDGIVNEDRLGLDAVYVQAKCYAEGNSIGRPAIQQFIGSLTGEGATKGVFVTTSSFSREACDYAARVQQRVVLIDGPELARLMIQYGVGVRTRRTYEVKSVDEDYFALPEGL